MCNLCDRDTILETWGVTAATLAAKVHYQQATAGFIPDGVGGDLKIPQYSNLLVVTVDDVADDISTTATLTVDAPSIVSTIDTIGDQDFYRVELVAGQVYDFGLYGKLAGPGGLPLSDAFLELYDAAGTLITSADGGAETPLNSVNSGFDVLMTYVADRTGTYYVNARAFDNIEVDGTNGDLVGDYELFVQDVTDEPRYVPYYEADSPLYSIDWGSQVDGTVRNPDGEEGIRPTGHAQGVADNPFGFDVAGKNVITIYFAKPGDVFVSQDLTNPGLPPATITATGAQQFERDAVMTALREFEKVADVVYVEVQDRAQANFFYTSYIGTPGPGVSLLGSMSPPGESDEGLAQFNSGDYRWNATDLQQGGFSFVTLIHEFGHGHGLAHPHDNGGRSGIMNGVTSDGPVADYTLGDYELNQAVFTMMSYQDGWQSSPYGNAPTDVGYGYLGGLMAFDIAAIQDKYGVNEDYNKGNNVYVLKDENAAGTYYYSIWDAGGNDTIQYDGTKDAHIDLRAASLEYEYGGGGWVSYVDGIFGGFTIANAVSIEIARGGSGNDVLLGNDAANTLMGKDGDDMLRGGGGNDKLLGGGGNDSAMYDDAASGVVVNLAVTTAQDTGSSGSDLLTGIENLVGSAFDDKLSGAAGANRLEGGDGNDILFGAAGNDTLVGGAGVDRLKGGGGADTFVFAGRDSSEVPGLADRIFDFSRSQGDRIDLSQIDANDATIEDDAFIISGRRAFSGVAGEIRITTVDDGFRIFGDTDGDRVADFMIVGRGDVPTAADLLL